MRWLLILLVACGKTTPPAPEASELVCCESYGFGAMMAKCCETYAWTKPTECSVPEGFTGGGKQVVDDGKCPPR